VEDLDFRDLLLEREAIALLSLMVQHEWRASQAHSVEKQMSKLLNGMNAVL
jgi:hypothetical protein